MLVAQYLNFDVTRFGDKGFYKDIFTTKRSACFRFAPFISGRDIVLSRDNTGAAPTTAVNGLDHHRAIGTKLFKKRLCLR